MRDFKLGNPDEGLSVILTEVEHKLITENLRLATLKVKTPQQLWKAYQKVYKDYPHWLEAIKSHFVKPT